MKYNVFISYSRKDSEEVDRICDILITNNLTFFRDTSEIKGGSEFFNDIVAAILSSDVFLYIGSKNSYNSKYTPREVCFAIDKERNIVPYLIDDAELPDNLAFAFANINVRRKSNGHNVGTILADVMTHIPYESEFGENTERSLEDIVYTPYYKEALDDFEYAHRLYYNEHFWDSGFERMELTALFNAKKAELRGLGKSAKAFISHVLTHPDTFEGTVGSDSYFQGELVKLSDEVRQTNERKKEIIEKLKKGVPVVNVVFADELSLGKHALLTLMKKESKADHEEFWKVVNEAQGKILAHHNPQP